MTELSAHNKYQNKLSRFAYSWCLQVRDRMKHSYDRQSLIAELESTFLLHESEFKRTLKEIYPLIDKYEKFMDSKTVTPGNHWDEPIIGLFILALDIFHKERYTNHPGPR